MRTCNHEFLYPEEWGDFRGFSDCQAKESLMGIEFPQPSLSEKRTPELAIQVEECCPIYFNETGEPHYSTNETTGQPQETKSMSLEEYVNQELDVANMFGYSILNSGDITLGRNPAYKVVLGMDGKPAMVGIYSINGTRLYSIHYAADPSDYHTYLPGVQKIVDSFRMLVS